VEKVEQKCGQVKVPVMKAKLELECSTVLEKQCKTDAEKQCTTITEKQCTTLS
jgi:hypothetical protein